MSYSRFVLYFFYPPPPGPCLSALGGLDFFTVGWMILLTIVGRGSLARTHRISLFTICQLRIAESGIPKWVSEK